MSSIPRFLLSHTEESTQHDDATQNTAATYPELGEAVTPFSSQSGAETWRSRPERYTERTLNLLLHNTDSCRLYTLGFLVSWSLRMRIFPMRIDLQQFLKTFSIASPMNKKMRPASLPCELQFGHHR